MKYTLLILCLIPFLSFGAAKNRVGTVQTDDTVYAVNKAFFSGGVYITNLADSSGITNTILGVTANGKVVLVTATGGGSGMDTVWLDATYYRKSFVDSVIAVHSDSINYVVVLAEALEDQINNLPVYVDSISTVTDSVIWWKDGTRYANSIGLAGYQPLDADLTTISGLSPVANDVLQYKSGAWVNRTMAQLKADMSFSNLSVDGTLAYSSGGSYNTTSPKTLGINFTSSNLWEAAQGFSDLVNFSGQILESGFISPSQLTANTNDWNIVEYGTFMANTVRFSTDASRDVTGLSGGISGQVVNLHNIGSFNAVFKDASVSSTFGNRFEFPSGDITLLPKEVIRLQYDGTDQVWRYIGKVPSAGGSGTVTSIATTSPITGGTITTTGTIGINDAAADGSTKGAASFTAADFNTSSGLVSLDYTNGQAASGSNKGFLTSADWSTFNGKAAASHTHAISTDVTGLASGVSTFLGTSSSANLRSALTDEVGTGAAYFVGGDLSTPSNGVLTNCTIKAELVIAVSDETTAITTGNGKVTFRMPYAATITGVRASLTTVSSSGIPTVDINEAGTTILSTKLTIDASEKTSTTAATAAVISDSSIADDAEMTVDIDVAGTGATGLKIIIYYTHN